MRVNPRVTPEEFRRMQLPEDRDWELHEGEIVELRFPSWSHREIQDRLVEFLTSMLPRSEYRVLSEMPFEPGLNDRSADTLFEPIAARSPRSLGVLPGAPRRSW